MIKQYPYVLLVCSMVGGGHDVHGNPIQPVEIWDQVSMCRDEANSKGSRINLVDGQAFIFDCLVQLPKTCPVLAVGTKVRVMQGDFKRQEGKILRFQPDQLHSRLWL